MVDIAHAGPVSEESYSLDFDSNFNGKTINLDNLSGSNYSELVDQLNEKINLNFTSDLPLYGSELSGNISGQAYFKNPESEKDYIYNLTTMINLAGATHLPPVISMLNTTNQAITLKQNLSLEYKANMM